MTGVLGSAQTRWLAPYVCTAPEPVRRRAHLGCAVALDGQLDLAQHVDQEGRGRLRELGACRELEHLLPLGHLLRMLVKIPDEVLAPEDAHALICEVAWVLGPPSAAACPPGGVRKRSSNKHIVTLVKRGCQGPEIGPRSHLRRWLHGTRASWGPAGPCTAAAGGQRRFAPADGCPARLPRPQERWVRCGGRLQRTHHFPMLSRPGWGAKHTGCAALTWGVPDSARRAARCRAPWLPCGGNGPGN